jgi:hypothetical protein
MRRTVINLLAPAQGWTPTQTYSSTLLAYVHGRLPKKCKIFVCTWGWLNCLETTCGIRVLEFSDDDHDVSRTLNSKSSGSYNVGYIRVVQTVCSHGLPCRYKPITLLSVRTQKTTTWVTNLEGCRLCSEDPAVHCTNSPRYTTAREVAV